MDSPKTTTITTATTTITTAATVSLSDSPPVQHKDSQESILLLLSSRHLGQYQTAKQISCEGFNVLRYLGQRYPRMMVEARNLLMIHWDLRKCSTYLNSRLIVDVQKRNNINNSEQHQPGSFSGCVDEYLSDPVDVDCADSVNLVSPNVKRSDEAHQSPESNLTNSKIAILESDGIIDMGMRGDASQDMPEQDGEDPKEQSTSETKRGKFEDEGNIVEQPSHVCPSFVSDLLVDHASRQQQCDTSGAQAAPPHVDDGEDSETVLHGTCSTHNAPWFRGQSAPTRLE
ncbi:hypothetical protein OIU74_025243 [Salix koriyanagi]|uniref:Uncharacterized protein n=1 Tax=Salix koriyanagi TaxID=2511006 RepID=A0A9Q0W1B2_9ROSI|nr:hypothetical protein OIU74_025243 [Salix koriyanagi]